MKQVRRFLLPDWARPEHLILQYELAHSKQPASRRMRFVQLLLIALMLGAPGYLYAAYIHVSPTQDGISDLAWRSLYFPTVLVQAATVAAGIPGTLCGQPQVKSGRLSPMAFSSASDWCS